MEMENTSNHDSLNQKIRELQESEERFRSIVEHSNEAIVVAQDKTVKFSNPRITELTGYTSEEMGSRDFVEFIHPEDRETVLREYQSRLSGEKPKSEYSVRIITKDGQEKYVIVSSALIDWDGRPATLAMITDITELKHTEEKLVKSEERFRSVMEQSPFPMELLTPDGKINQVNPSWYKLWGIDEVSAAETLEKYNMITDPQLKKLGVADLVKKAFSGEHVILPPIIYDSGQTVVDFELENIKGLRSPWIQSHLYPIKDENGELEYVVNTYVDITDLKQAKEEVQQSKEYILGLMEQSPLDIAIYTPDGRLADANPAFYRKWGFSREEATEVFAKYNQRTDKQLEDLGLAPLVEKAYAGEAVVLPPMEYIGSRASEEFGVEGVEVRTRWIQIHLYPIKAKNGSVAYVVNTNVDITELKQAEQKAEEQREVLARMDRATRMGQLTGSIAHELNQPLTGILSNAQAAELMLKSDQWKREDYEGIIADIIADTKRAGDVIRNLRELYRKQKGEYTHVDINSVAEEAIQLLHSDFVIKQVELIPELVPSIPLVNGNKFQLQQVLVNLIMNGEQAMSSIEQENRKLHIATTFDEYEVKLWVDDFGPGIEEDKIDHIFEPLVTWKPGGTGMGLAISNSIIEAHGGKMWAENLKAGGARVGFVLPVMKKENKT
jgi:PAS domain S-box-containing protein